MPDMGATIRRKMDAVAREIDRAERTALARAGLAAKQITLAEINADTGDGRMSGIGKNGAKISARFDVTGDSVKVRMVGGAAAILERGRHTATPVKPKKRGGKKAIATPWGPRASAQGSTAAGHHTFDRAFEKSKPVIDRVLRDPIVDAAVRGFKS